MQCPMHAENTEDWFLVRREAPLSPKLTGFFFYNVYKITQPVEVAYTN
jgi:hypothetical protein